MAFKTATATFTGAEDFVDVTWTTMPGPYGISYGILPTDGSTGLVVWLTSVTDSGARVNISSRFSGTVELQIYDKPS